LEELSYYPGCSLHGTSEEYDLSIQAVCQGLDIRLHELTDWTCCGASSAHALNDPLAQLLAARNLVLAEKEKKDVVVPCAACFSRLKFAENSRALEWVRREERAMENSPVNVLHIHDFLADQKVLQKLKSKVKKPLAGLKAVPYYGCLTVRPPKITKAKNPENPVALDEILETLGAGIAKWSFKTDCCGGSFSLSKPDVVVSLSGDLMEAAKHAGADCFVTDCPMCQANLDSRQKEIEKERGKKYGLPVLFITELMALAMGIEATPLWLKKHLVDPFPILRKRGLI